MGNQDFSINKLQGEKKRDEEGTYRLRDFQRHIIQLQCVDLTFSHFSLKM